MWSQGILFVLTPEEVSRLCRRMDHCDPDGRSGRMLVAAYDWLQHLNVFRPDQLLDGFEFLDRHLAQALFGPSDEHDGYDPVRDRPLLGVTDWTWLTVTYSVPGTYSRVSETIDLKTGESLVCEAGEQPDWIEKLAAAVTQASCELSALETRLALRERALRQEGQDAHDPGTAAGDSESGADDDESGLFPPQPSDRRSGAAD